MSYGFQLFHPAVRKQMLEGQELDEFQHPSLDREAIARFVEGLSQYGYQVDSTTSRPTAFVKHVGRCPVQVSIYDSEIAFTIPYWKNSEEAIFEALQDASELADSEHMVLFNPQEGGWADA